MGEGLDRQLDFLTDAIGSTDVVRLSVVSTSAVPLPAALWLFSAGLLSLVGFGRGRKL
ncbi:MAG: hypothetical protein GXP22_07255 [Gammaproteobacteria bacterium]|nr:hypothetical protein [Gammaproteobacteria bacterium]